MPFSHIMTSNYVTVMDLTTGEVTKLLKGDEKFDEAVALVREGRLSEVPPLTVKHAINAVASTTTDKAVSVRIFGGRVMYKYKNFPEAPLHNTMTDRIMKMVSQGFSADPFVAFMENLLQNPSKTAIDEVYLFMEANELPMTSDGHLIAYKIVNNDFTSIHDSNFRNDVGTVVEMPRGEVDDNRDRTCSRGLHFCSKEYLTSYGSTERDSDRVVLLKINPADIVSIPSDYHNAKGRACKYLIMQDITEDNWRTTLKERDYTDRAVVPSLPVEDYYESVVDSSSCDSYDSVVAISAPVEEDTHSKGFANVAKSMTCAQVSRLWSKF